MGQRLECLAMLLAGGKGKRLDFLTKKMAKPVIPFGVKYRIIDFALSNCTNSGINTIGVLAQHKSHTLTSYIGDGSSWKLERLERGEGITVLPPFAQNKWIKSYKKYKGTADAVFQNINFIELYNPRYVLVLAGDHIYQMNYRHLINYHREREAEVTIATTKVPWKETSRFGILETATNGHVTEFQEKPIVAQNNLASMGIYLFNLEILKKYLWQDQNNPQSSNDFGRDILPLMLKENCRIFAYPFQGYWMDVGTVRCFWKANMELLQNNPRLNLYNPNWPVYSAESSRLQHYPKPGTKIKRSLVGGGCQLLGKINHSILFPRARVGNGTIIRDSIIMSNVRIGANTTIVKTIIAPNSTIGDNCRICPLSDEKKKIIPINENSFIPDNSIINTAGQFHELSWKNISKRRGL